MDNLPIDILKLILDYKYKIDVSIKYNKCMKQIKKIHYKIQESILGGQICFRDNTVYKEYISFTNQKCLLVSNLYSNDYTILYPNGSVFVETYRTY